MKQKNDPIEEKVALLLIKVYQETAPGLINTICMLKSAGQTPLQIETEMMKRGDPRAEEYYLIAKYLKVLGKARSN